MHGHHEYLLPNGNGTMFRGGGGGGGGGVKGDILYYMYNYITATRAGDVIHPLMRPWPGTGLEACKLLLNIIVTYEHGLICGAALAPAAMTRHYRQR